MSSRRIFIGLVAVLLLAFQVNAMAMIGASQGYDIGALNLIGVKGTGVATGGNVLSVQNEQNVANIGRCWDYESVQQQQSGILVQGATAVACRGESGAVQGACVGADQSSLVGWGRMGCQGLDVGLSQTVGSEGNAGVEAGQGFLGANAQLMANKGGVSGSASVAGATQTSAAQTMGPCSDALSSSTVRLDTNQSNSAM